jgi:hypothetical protein
MTTDPNEITQAAARLEANRYSHAPVGMVQWTKDVTLLAKYGYERFAAVPADDGEPVTEEWLLDLGFRECYGFQYQRMVVLEEDSLYIELNAKQGGGWTSQFLSDKRRLKQDVTRGDVLRLCAALGVPLPDHPKGGA